MTEPQLRELPARRYAGLRATVTMDDLPGVVDKGFPQLFGHVGRPAGPPFIRYYAFEPLLDVELGVPAAGGAEELPAGTYLTLLHVGPYSGLRDAHVRLRAWADEQGIALGAALETYLTDPREQPDASEWETEIAYAVASTSSPV